MYIEMDCPCQGKNLDKLLQPLVLSILAAGGEMHGFAILKEIAKEPRFEGKAPDATGVYRYLKKMEASGLLTSRWEIDEAEESGKPRRIFAITPQGKGCLANWSQALEDYDRYIRSLIERIYQAI